MKEATVGAWEFVVTKPFDRGIESDLSRDPSHLGEVASSWTSNKRTKMADYDAYDEATLQRMVSHSWAGMHEYLVYIWASL